MNVQAKPNSFVKNQLTEVAARHMATEIFAQLQNEGCKEKDIINISTQLLDLVAASIKGASDKFISKA